MNAQTDTTSLLDASDDDLKAMGLPPAFTLEELQAALSDEEIKRLSEGDDPIVKMPEAEGDADGDDDDPDDDETGGGDDEASDDGEAAEGEDAKGDAEESADDPAARAAPDDSPDPVFQPRDVSQAKAVVEGADEEKRKLRESWGDGELSDDEYHEKLDELSDKIADAKADIKDAEREDARAQQGVMDAWFGKVDAYLDAHPGLRNNEPIPQLEGHSYLTAFDTVLKTINQDPRYAGLSMNQRIEAGAHIVRSYVQKQTGADILGFEAEKKPSKGQAKDETDDPREVARKKAAAQGKRPDPVQTLGNVTAATETEADNSRFATIDREKSGLDREREFSRLSPEEQEAYLRGM